MLDGHFVIEHTARNRSGRFFNFNGTAGVWRRQTIVDAGGWQHDTLTEDVDLSYRAQLKGWQFIFLPEVVSPAEVPVEMNAFKSQQHRWAKGSIQTARKLLPAIFRSSLPRSVKIEAFFHLTNNVAYPLMVVLSLLMPISVVIRYRHGWYAVLLLDFPFFVTATMSVCGFFVASQREVGQPWFKQLRFLPFLMSLGIGLSVNNSRAVIEALFNTRSVFMRTPQARRFRPGARVARSATAGHSSAGSRSSRSRWVCTSPTPSGSSSTAACGPRCPSWCSFRWASSTWA